MMMSRSSRAPVPAVTSAGGEDGSGEIMLFGVRVKVDPMRKSVSMNNLSEYELPNHNSNNIIAVDHSAAAGGYASADDVVHHQSTASRERKRGLISITSSFIYLFILLVSVFVFACENSFYRENRTENYYPLGPFQLLCF